jgi:hypothetical protein
MSLFTPLPAKGMVGSRLLVLYRNECGSLLKKPYC